MSVVIEDTLCSSAMRKDCASKKTCHLRHLNEEAGKDLEYYTRKFLRATHPECVSDSDTRFISFPTSLFLKEKVRVDGHCIVHSVLSLLEEKGKPVPTRNELLVQVKEVFQANLVLYAPFIDSLETDPIEELDMYINNAKYDSGIIDLIVPLIAKCLDEGIVVVQYDKSSRTYTSNSNFMYPSPESISDDPLYLLKSGSHYDPLHKVSSSCLESLNVADVADVISHESMPDNASANSTQLLVEDIGSKSQIADDSEHTTDVSVDSTAETASDCENDLDPVRILASICANAPDYEIRDCLRKYSLDFSLKRQKSAFNTVTKPILIKSAEYLNVATDKLNKPDLINLLICKIQNLLPDTCQICNVSYVSNVNDPPFLSCSLCGQEVHKQCWMAKLGLSGDSVMDIHKLINPFQLPGFHYFCRECETTTTTTTTK